MYTKYYVFTNIHPLCSPLSSILFQPLETDWRGIGRGRVECGGGGHQPATDQQTRQPARPPTRGSQPMDN